MNITLNAKLDRLEALAERIAVALELAVGITPSGTEAKENVLEPAVSYSTPEDLLREEILKIRGTPESERET